MPHAGSRGAEAASNAGLVQDGPGGGLVVRDVDVGEVFNLCVVRLPFEKLAMVTMPPATDADPARFRATLAANCRTARRSRPPAGSRETSTVPSERARTLQAAP
jgi:DNA-binding GntR family transcriptional regulator